MPARGRKSAASEGYDSTSKFNSPVVAIMEANGLVDSRLSVGQELIVPLGPAAPVPTPTAAATRLRADLGRTPPRRLDVHDRLGYLPKSLSLVDSCQYSRSTPQDCKHRLPAPRHGLGEYAFQFG